MYIQHSWEIQLKRSRKDARRPHNRRMMRFYTVRRYCGAELYSLRLSAFTVQWILRSANTLYAFTLFPHCGLFPARKVYRYFLSVTCGESQRERDQKTKNFFARKTETFRIILAVWRLRICENVFKIIAKFLLLHSDQSNLFEQCDGHEISGVKQ